ncbi:MAG: hypothetical protein JWP63_4305 [Candidatus Solibacter sp.]|nr:hypothetical protein [Candidatus Solibacter sp.]
MATQTSCTSAPATMVADRSVTGVERWTAVGDFAGKLFGNGHR